MSKPAGQGTGTALPHAFPFRQLFTLGVLHLRLRPEDVWSLTPRELFALLAPLMPPLPPDRATLNDLLRQYGDDVPITSHTDRD